MFASLKKTVSSGKFQLNVLGLVFLVLIGFLGWQALTPFTWLSVIPLAFFAYAAFWIGFELTLNRKNIPSLATSLAGRNKVVELLKAEAANKTTYTIVDFGSGRGQITRKIAKTIPNATVMGFELAPVPFFQSRLIQRLWGLKNLSYYRQDFLTFDCTKVDAVYFYLTPTLVQKIGEKLWDELKPGSTVISHTFPLLGKWTPVETLTFFSPFKETLYVYKKS